MHEKPEPERPQPENHEAAKPLPEIQPAELDARQPQLAESRGAGKVGFLRENIAGALSYLTFIPALIFLFVAPFRTNRFVRFHALQCLLCWGAAIVLIIGFKLAGDVVFLIPAGPLFVTIVDVLAGMATVFVWLVLLVKAIQGEMFRLPVLGNLAEQHSVVASGSPTA